MWLFQSLAAPQEKHQSRAKENGFGFPSHDFIFVWFGGFFFPHCPALYTLFVNSVAIPANAP